MFRPLSDPAFNDHAQSVKILAIDFDGVMTDNKVYVFEDGREAVVCSRLEGFGLRRVEEAGVYCLILSTEKNPVVSARARKLGIACIQDVADKVATFAAELRARGLSMHQAAFIGNDINDRPLLERVGLPIVVADAHEDLADLDAFITARRGGDGAVRELCDALAHCINNRS